MTVQRSSFVCRHCGQIDLERYAAALEAALTIHEDTRLAYTIAEAAAMTGWSERYLQRLIANNELPVVKSSSRGVRIRREALEAYLVAHETEVTAWPHAKAGSAQLFGRDRKTS